MGTKRLSPAFSQEWPKQRARFPRDSGTMLYLISRQAPTYKVLVDSTPQGSTADNLTSQTGPFASVVKYGIGR